VAPSSAWSPLGYATFRWLWLASIASNIGTWMHEVGAGWLMTSLSASPMNVALVQVAGAAPMFFLALPAGALADIVDRRRYLLLVQMWMAAVAPSSHAQFGLGLTRDQTLHLRPKLQRKRRGTCSHCQRGECIWHVAKRTAPLDPKWNRSASKRTAHDQDTCPSPPRTLRAASRSSRKEGQRESER
jgi:hypothetical protein